MAGVTPTEAMHLPEKLPNSVYTLPVSCQICLGMVKQPLLCSNFHVFCETCINLWLEKSHQCPVCRVSINDSNPVQEIRGGHCQGDMLKSTPEIRKTRFNLIYKDYEDALEQLQCEVKTLKAENSLLQARLLSDTSGSQTVSDNTTGGIANDSDRLLLLTRKLQDAQKLYDNVKQDISKLKKENSTLQEEKINLGRQNSRLREEVSSRSPMKYGRMTVATLESQLEGQRKEVQRLTKALERSDHYIEDLEQQLSKSQASVKVDRKSGQVASGHSEEKAYGRHEDTLLHSAGTKTVLSELGFPRQDYQGVDNNGFVKRQLFTSNSVGKVEREAQPLTLDHEEDRYSRQLVAQKGGRSGMRPNCEVVPESIIKATDSPLKRESKDSERTPTKKVHFNLQAKNREETSSFDLEAPSPLTSTPNGKYRSSSSIDSFQDRLPQTQASTDSLSNSDQRNVHDRHVAMTHSTQKEDGGDIARDTFLSYVGKRSQSDMVGDMPLPRKKPQKQNSETDWTRKAQEVNNSCLSQPDCSSPQSLTGFDSRPASVASRVSTVNKQEAVSFDLEGPGLDDTQKIQTELDDLDISMTPELSDCLKLLNRAERKRHSADSPIISTKPGTCDLRRDFSDGVSSAENFRGQFSASAHGDREDFQKRQVHGNYLATCPQNATGPMSGWEHGFFSSLRVNPYKHTSTLSHVQPNYTNQGFAATVPSHAQGPSNWPITDQEKLVTSKQQREHLGRIVSTSSMGYGLPSTIMPNPALTTRFPGSGDTAMLADAKPAFHTQGSTYPRPSSSSISSMANRQPARTQDCDSIPGLAGRTLTQDFEGRINSGVPSHVTSLVQPYSSSHVTNLERPYSSIHGTNLDQPYSSSRVTNLEQPYSSSHVTNFDQPYSSSHVTNRDQPCNSTSSHVTNLDRPYSSTSSHVTNLDQPYSSTSSHVTNLDQPYSSRETRVGQNYSYVSTASSTGNPLDSKPSDSFLLPEPKKRLFEFESEDEVEFSSPVKTTKTV